MLLHEEQQKAVELILSNFDGNLSKVIAEVERLLNRYMMETPLNTTSALKFDVAFNQILAQAGYYELVNKMIDSDYDQMFGLIIQGFSAGGLAMAYTAEDVKRVMALKALQANRFTVVGSTAGTALKENLFKYVLSNYTADDMQRQLIEDFKGTNLVRHSGTLANTSIKEFQESMIDIGAEGLDGMVWVYAGDKNSNNRDFCRCILDKKGYYDEDDKNKMQYAPERRYNCIHRFRPITEDFAKHKGFKKMNGAAC